MREYSVPSTITVADEECLTDSVFAHAENFPSDTLFRRRGERGWTDVSCAEFAAQVAAVAKGLMASGVSTGDRVGLLAATRYEWCLTDYAIWSAGAVTVPIYETSSPEQVQWILDDSGAVAVVVEHDEHTARVAQVRDRCPNLTHVWQIEGADPAVEVLTAAGTAVTDADVQDRRAVGADALATLIYTSGTTGRPKGCELTHRNLVAESRIASAAFSGMIAPGQSNLMFLPMAHVFARAISVAALDARVVIGHTADVKNLLNDLGEFRPSFLLAVPRVFEKVYNSSRQKAHGDGKGKIFDAADATAVAYSRAIDTGGAGLVLKLRHTVFDKLVYTKLRAALGGRCTAAVAGGAPLGERLGHFFRGIGVPVYEGYGLTETSAAITANTPSAQRIGTVGTPLSGCGVKIAEDGEILLRGDVVLRGYWRNEAATAESLAEGWFHTGDLGSLDSDGYLSIVGRKKEIIVTAGGKNVAPAALEDSLRAHPLISQCMVVGDKQPFIGALITIDPEAFPAWLERTGKPAGTEVSAMIADPDLVAEVDAAVATANSAVSRAEAIKSYRILPVDFTEDGGELTPSLKLKRNVVASTYAADIDKIYAQERSA